MKRFYRIAQQTICIDAPHFSDDSVYWQPFELGESEAAEFDLNIRCEIVDELPVPTDFPSASRDGVCVYHGGGELFRNKAMGTVPGVLTKYGGADSSKSTSFFTPHSFNTMMDSRYMWDSVSIAQLLLQKQTLLIHASYIRVGAKGLLFSAPCGTGKSTQAQLWREHRGAEILNGDKTAVSLHGGGIYAHGVPFCGTSDICKNESLPLGGIVILSQAKTNSITRLTGIDAVQRIIENIYLDFLAPGEQQKCIDLIIEILSSVPVFSLACTPDERAVEALEKQLGGMV